MKRHLLFLIAALSLVVSQSTQAANPSIGLNTNLNVTNNTRLAAMQAGNSILVKKYDYSSVADADKCHKYKGLRTAGIVLLSVGGATLGGGIAMSHIGIRSAINDDLDTYTQVNLIAGGVVLGVFGVAMLATGTALTISGSVKYRKYCGAAGSTGSIRNFYISPSARGLGLAARF